MIYVVATIQIAPGKRASFLEHFHALVPRVRAEMGCLEYGPAVDFPMEHPRQKLAGPDTVIVVEKWNGPAELEAHGVAPHMEEYRRAVKDLVISVTLQILQPA